MRDPPAFRPARLRFEVPLSTDDATTAACAPGLDPRTRASPRAVHAGDHAKRIAALMAPCGRGDTAGRVDYFALNFFELILRRTPDSRAAPSTSILGAADVPGGFSGAAVGAAGAACRRR